MDTGNDMHVVEKKYTHTHTENTKDLGSHMHNLMSLCFLLFIESSLLQSQNVSK